jgi:hypothetical protein
VDSTGGSTAPKNAAKKIYHSDGKARIEAKGLKNSVSWVKTKAKAEV